jgi:hypothetical protein
VGGRSSTGERGAPDVPADERSTVCAAGVCDLFRKGITDTFFERASAEMHKECLFRWRLTREHETCKTRCADPPGLQWQPLRSTAQLQSHPHTPARRQLDAMSSITEAGSRRPNAKRNALGQEHRVNFLTSSEHERPSALSDHDPIAARTGAMVDRDLFAAGTLGVGLFFRARRSVM